VKFKVIYDRVLVKRDSAKETSHLMIPEKVKKPPRTGLVLEVGEEVKYVVRGDHVVFSEYAGHFLEHSQDLAESDLIVMREDEVLAVEDVKNDEEQIS